MKLSEAIKLLKAAPRDGKPSAINKTLTREQAASIVEKPLATFGRPVDKPCGPDDDIHELMELRVWQVVKNQKRPRY